VRAVVLTRRRGGAVYGAETEIVVGDEDTQPLETPIIAPVKTKQFEYVEPTMPRTSFDFKCAAAPGRSERSQAGGAGGAPLCCSRSIRLPAGTSLA
jgi:hypothetical protein